MLKKILKEVVTLIVGKQVEDIVDLLDTNKHINEFIIAKKLDLTINQTRNILYKISDHGLVSYIRKKDKKKGWYTYFWKIEILKSLEFMENNLLKKIDQLEHKIKSRETKRFYICERCNLELSEENALLYNFTCNECGDILSLKDNTKFVREMKKSLEKLKKDLVFLEEEMKKETEKVEKIKLKEIRKEERAKKKKRVLKKKPIKRKKVVKKKKPIKRAKKSVKKTKKRLKPKPKTKKKSIKRPKTQKIKKPKKKIKKKPKK
jgi:transcription factor E